MIHRDLVPGKLRIVRRIGAGGMGVVYEAIHLGLDRRVAVKVIHPQSSESAEARTRFFREARALAQLQSEHIVQVLDVDTLPEGDPYMVMEYLDGRDLRRELSKRGPLPVAEAVGYLIQASFGVAAAHGAGIIHRDIKPANIFVTNLDGARRAKILDFGLAKFSTSLDQALTGPTCVLGTPLYMSPEQLAGQEADSRCDVWALGVVLFQLLTGHSPFRPKNNEGPVGAVLNRPAAPLHEERDDVPLALSQVVARCLEKVHAERFEDARELAAALAPFGPREPTVRASLRAPRGSSAPPPTAPADNDLAPQPIATRAAEPLSARELITVTHPGLAKPPAALQTSASVPVSDGERVPLPSSTREAPDSDATIRFRAPSHAPVQAASPQVIAAPDEFRAPQPAAWRKWAPPIGGLLMLGVVFALCLPLRARTPEAPAVARPSSSTSVVNALAPSQEPAVAARIEPAASVVVPASSAPELASSAMGHARPAALMPGSSVRTSLPRTTAKPRPVLSPTPPSPAIGGSAVPLHL